MGGMIQAINIVCSSVEQAESYREEIIKKIFVELYGIEHIPGLDYETENNVYDSDIEIRNASGSLPYVTILTLESNFRLNKVWNLFYNLFKEICKRLEPVCAYFLGYDLEFPIHGSFFEYHKDPYFFSIESSMGDDKLFYLKHKGSLNDIKKAKSLMSKKELLSLIKKNTFDSFETKSGGVGCWKIENEAKRGINSFFVYPRYFIRKELKKRGLKITDGLPEKYAQELGIE